MARVIAAARDAKDSVGGVVEVVARGVPAGWGDPTMARLDALLSAALLSIPATKGVEIGDAFANAALTGTQAQASTALGQTVQAPVRGKATVEGGVACVFYGPSVKAGTDPDVPVNDSVRVVLVVGSNATTWFSDYKSKVPAQTITGLGDQAYFDGSASVSVLKGDEYLRVAVIGVANFEDAEKALAQAVLPLM